MWRPACYSLTAKATDNLNGTTTSSPPVNVTVNAAIALYYIHTDHLNTPRLIANNVAQTVWQWDTTDPFANNAPNENPSGQGNFTCNLRLPGQYFDKETNLHYNHFRDYDPQIGRYIQSDPIGLAGGINTYGYAGGNPLSWIDTDGRQPLGRDGRQRPESGRPERDRPADAVADASRTSSPPDPQASLPNVVPDPPPMTPMDRCYQTCLGREGKFCAIGVAAGCGIICTAAGRNPLISIPLGIGCVLVTADACWQLAQSRCKTLCYTQ